MEQHKKPKLLFALSRMPYPAIDGTRLKLLHNITDGVKEDFEIEFFLVSLEKIKAEDLKYFEEHYGKVYLFKLSKIRFLWNSLQSLYSALPLQTSGFFTRSAKKWLYENISTYDVVYVHTIRMSEYFRNLTSMHKKIVIDFNDAISLNYQKSKLYAQFPLNIIYSIEEKRIREYETKILRTFSYFNVVSEYDKQYLLSVLKDKIVEERIIFKSIPQGAPIPTFMRQSGLPQNIYFIGQLDYEMNRSAITFFLDHIWVDLKKVLPHVQLYIIGKGGKRIYKKYHYVDGVHFTGYVENQYELFAQCSCMVAPILSGAGMPTKIIEALSCGIPVVTTPQGAQGIQGTKHTDNSIILTAEDTDAWVQAIQELLTVESFNQSISTQARQLFEQYYELSQVQRVWLQFIDEVYKK